MTTKRRAHRLDQLRHHHADRSAAAPVPVADHDAYLDANKSGVATDNLRTYSDLNSTIYNGIELSANMRLDKLLLFGA